MFTELENDRPFLKLALEGFAGDGKTFTAVKIAIGVHKLIKSTKPIALFDTEKALKALKAEFDREGIKPVINASERSLAAVNKAITWCEEGNADILIIDSITHVWEEFLKAYLNRPDKYGKEIRRNRLEFQDWGVIKPQWKEQFSTPFVLAKCHIIFTGRAGYEYTDEKNEDGKREIFKSGIKMKAENETAFEPDILVLMQKQQELLQDKPRIWRQALIVKDRTNTIDGKSFENPTFDDFFPAVKILLDGTIREAHGPQIPDTFAEFENKYSEIGKEREVMIAEIEGCFEIMGLGTGKEDKQVKAWTLSQVFAVNSIEMVGKKSNEVIKKGMEVLRGFANEYRDYISLCLDNEQAPEKGKIQEIMKGLLKEMK